MSTEETQTLNTTTPEETNVNSESVNETPVVDETPVNDDAPVVNPDPPKKKLDKAQAKQWFIDFNKENGVTVSDNEATSFAESKNVKSKIGRAYRYNVGKTPEAKVIDSLYSSWEVDIDPIDEILSNSTLNTDINIPPPQDIEGVIKAEQQDDTEKKNPNQSNQTTAAATSVSNVSVQAQNTESNSPLEEEDSLLDYYGYYNQDYTYQENVNGIPQSVLEMSEADASLTLNNTLGQYGVEVIAGSEDDPMGGITIRRPDNVTKTFPLFNDAYKTRLSAVNPNSDPNDLLTQRHSEMLSFINASQGDNLTYQTNLLRDANAEDLPSKIGGYINSALIPSSEDMAFVIGLLPNRKMNDYFDDGNFKYELWRTDIQRADGSLSKDKMADIRQRGLESTQVQQDNTRVRTPEINTIVLDPNEAINTDLKVRNRREGLKKIQALSESFNTKKTIASASLGAALRVSGAYKKIDITDPQSIADIRAAGLLPGDLPMEQIKINGKPSTVNEIQKILYDYNSIQAVREGKIKLEIGDPLTAGVLSDQIAQVKDLMRTQEAYDNDGILGVDNGVTDWLRETGEVIEASVTELGLSSWELLSNISYIGYDSMVAAGVPDSVAQNIMYGNTGLPGIANVRSLLDPKLVKYARNEFQPEYSGGIFDSEGIGEFVTKTVKPVAGSLVYTGLFIANPYVGLAATGLGSYGGDRVYQNSRIQELKEKQSLGFALSPQEQQMINQSGAMSRLNSLTKAGVETGVTALFTFRYFKGLKGATKFTGPKTVENSRKIADAYAKNIRQSVAGKVAKFMGVDKKAILAELPEENIIALTNYYVDVHFGLDTWDGERARKLMAETSLVAVTSGYSMGVGARAVQNSQTRKIGEQQVNRNINLPQENEVVLEKLNIDAAVNKIKKDAEQGIVSLEGNQEFETLLELQTETDTRVEKFDSMKQDLVNKMSVNDKAVFLDLLAKIEKQNAAISSEGTSNNVKKRNEKNIADLKKKAKNILNKYPSDLSFYFADQSVQDQYIEKAIEVISEEKIKAGEQNFTLKSEDDVVFERAAQLHTQAITDGIVKNRQDLNAAEYIGLNVASDFLVEVNSEELKDWSLENDILTVEDMLSQNELFGELTVPADQATQENPDGKPMEVKEEDGSTVVTFENTGAGKVDPKVQMQKDRTLAIVNRIKSLNLDSDFANDLPKKQYEELKNFFDNAKAGKKIAFGKIESILDAHDIAIQISAGTGGTKINVGSSLKGVLKEDGSLTEKGLKLYNNIAQLVSNGIGFNTATVEGMSLIRDTEIGAPLHNLVQEGMRATAEAKQKAGRIKTAHTAQYKADVEAYNKKNGTNYSTDPRANVSTSYEMSILSLLRRRTGQQTPDGMDTEFARTKNLILEELALREKEAGEKNASESTKRKYEEWKNAVEGLGVADATSYDDISAKALPFNVDAIARMSEAMPGERAIDRINDFESYDAFKFEEGSYTPIFMAKGSDGSVFNDYFGPSNNDGIAANSGKNVTRPETLGTDLRLSPGLYWDAAYGQLNGMEMEIGAKKQYETLDNLLQNPTFLDAFEDSPLKDILLTNFEKRSERFRQDVRNSNVKVTDIGSPSYTNTLTKALNSLYGGASALALTRITQPMSQFTSAWSGTYPIIKNTQARNYLRKRGLSFFAGAAGSFNANNKVGRLFGYFDSQGKLGNIYQKSRTGLRNALASQLAIDPNQSMPADYYVKELKLNDKQGKLLQGMGGQLTLDRVLEAVNSSSESALNFFLANADKAAANMAFEAHYLDYKINQGENVSDLDAFWEKENANPDLEAIKYADGIIDRTMRQSDPAGEALVYSNELTKNSMRFFMPFQKFILNAKADFSNQIMILQDPNIPELQKQDARRFLQGKLNEIVSFNAVKYAGTVATLKGLSGLLGLGMDEDDIERSGGMDGIISNFLPIAAEGEIDPFESIIAEASTLEERNAALSAQSGFKELESTIKGFEQYAMSFDNKFSTGDTYPVIGQTVQDAIQTLNPVPTTGFMNDMMAWSVNRIYGEDIAREFSSRSLTSEAMDGDSYKELIIKKAGVYSIIAEYADRFLSSSNLREKGTFIINKGDFKNQEVYLTAPNDEMRQKVVNAVDFLYQLRIHSVMNPVAPRADLDKFADRLERTLEKYFTQSKPDGRLLRMMGKQGPLQENQ